MEDAARTYVDFEPPHSIVEEPRETTIVVDLSAAGFVKEQLTVQLDSLGRVRIRGERPLAGNQWSRFHMALPIPEGCDAGGAIRCKFRDGALYVTMPRSAAATEEPGAGSHAETGGAGRREEPGAGSHAETGGAGRREEPGAGSHAETGGAGHREEPGAGSQAETGAAGAGQDGHSKAQQGGRHISCCII